MSYWAVVYGIDGWFHIAPCDSEKRILAPHIASYKCPCRPVEDAKHPESILVHNDPERGGTNA